jgi:hypothetical protein
MTDEPRLDAQGQMWGLSSLKRATVGQERAEGTAKEVWYWLEKIGQPSFLWNVFPLHPHLPGETQTNRTHTRTERDAAIHFLTQLYTEMHPPLVVALGKDADRILESLNIPHVPVRHPSMGGLTDFRAAMRKLLNSPSNPMAQRSHS